MEGMNTIVTTVITATIVDSAACNNVNICTVCHIKIIVNQIGHSRYTYHYRDENLLSLCLPVNENIDSRLVLFFLYFDMFAVTVTDGNTILTEIKSTFLCKAFADLIKHTLGCFFYFNHQHFPPSFRHF